MIEKIRYRLVYNRKNTLNNQGTALVQIEALLHKRKLYISTNVYLRPEEWDKDRAQVVNHPHAPALNAMLYEKIIELQSVEIAYWKQGISPSLLDIKKAVKGHVTVDMTFLQFAHRSVATSKRRDGTKQNIYATLHHIKTFQGDLEIKDVNYKFIVEFEAYLRATGLKVNSVGKHLRNVRTLVNEAINQGYLPLSDYPFRKFKIQKEKPEHRVLTKKELAKLERMTLKSKSRQRVLDAFLFCCYTGLRFSDFKQIMTKDISAIKGTTWISFKSLKTGISQKIPISMLFSGKALELIEKYGEMERMNRIGCNADVNRTLKEIVKGAGISKRVTFHTSRHTFATLLLADGVSITTIQKLLDHTSVKTTQIYSEVLDDTLTNDLRKAMKRRVKMTEKEKEVEYG